ncbi:DUF4041 domain-containing protein [uncultured Paraglaciecola sp.]|uniref:DUF4041 domain-containing protein n=1 Tax=uncultured Paraglaciecola sp. TaxID=1765024 RepID=UPI0026207644|nr:DUF4041 domain-containing protein [uncultured Paraglaciecola sp.]
MLKEIDLHQSLWIALTVLTALIAFMIYSTSQKRKNLEKEIKRKNNALKEKCIDEIVSDLQQSLQQIELKVNDGKPIYNRLQEILEQNTAQLKFIDVGIFPPTFNFDDRESLKHKIEECLKEQFQVIKRGRATTAYSNWEWFGSKSKGRQMVNAYQNLLLKAFNAEFDFIRKKMRYSSYHTAVDKLHNLESQLDKLGETANVTIASEYFDLKLQELGIWHSELEYREKLKQEKKKQQALLREQAKLTGGDTEELEDDIYYRKSDLRKAKKAAEQLHGASANDMKIKIARMQKEIEKLENKFARAMSQAQITKAGYIYVISNLGSFGDKTVKIGMTRRLEPMDRVKELGDASVPFKFDVHTLTFVGDAPKVEKMLHRKFQDKRVNEENYRKEFFRVTPQEVAVAMDELGVECDWFYETEAKEFRESLLMRKAFKQSESAAQPKSNQIPASI